MREGGGEEGWEEGTNRERGDGKGRCEKRGGREKNFLEGEGGEGKGSREDEREGQGKGKSDKGKQNRERKK